MWHEGGKDAVGVGWGVGSLQRESWRDGGQESTVNFVWDCRKETWMVCVDFKGLRLFLYNAYAQCYYVTFLSQLSKFKCRNISSIKMELTQRRRGGTWLSHVILKPVNDSVFRHKPGEESWIINKHPLLTLLSVN